MTPRPVHSPDDVRLATYEAGPADAPAIVLVHGWSQASGCWRKQMTGPLAERFRLVAPDLRGHGASGKPVGEERYLPSQVWADDLEAVTADLDRFVLVGWSMGGRVALDWLAHHGEGRLAGLVLVGASSLTPAEANALGQRKPDVVARGMYSDDPWVSIPATIAFLKACASAPLSKVDLAAFAAMNALCPPDVREAARLRERDHDYDLGSLAAPLALFWGEAERVCTRSMIDATLEAAPRAALTTFAGAGHLCFWERPEDFDAALAAFADQAFAGQEAA